MLRLHFAAAGFLAVVMLVAGCGGEGPTAASPATVTERVTVTAPLALPGPADPGVSPEVCTIRRRGGDDLYATLRGQHARLLCSVAIMRWSTPAIGLWEHRPVDYLEGSEVVCDLSSPEGTVSLVVAGVRPASADAAEICRWLVRAGWSDTDGPA